MKSSRIGLQRCVLAVGICIAFARTAAAQEPTIEPEVLLRGQTTTVRLTGLDAATLQTFRIDPARGVEITSISEVATAPGKPAVVAATISVDADAEAGERTVLMIPAAEASTPPRKAGTIWINAHPVEIGDIRLEGSATGQVLVVTAIDDAGDLTFTTRLRPATDTIALLDAPLIAELACDDQTVLPVILDVRYDVVRKDARTVEVKAKTLGPISLGCLLRVRVSDAAGNVSRWTSPSGQTQTTTEEPRPVFIAPGAELPSPPVTPHPAAATPDDVRRPAREPEAPSPSSTGTADEAEVLKLILGGDPNARDRTLNRTALMWAIHLKLSGQVGRFLADPAADLNATDRNGQTALMLAAGTGATATVQTLLDRVLDVSAADGTGATALHHAARSHELGTVNVISALVAGGIDLNVADNEGRTAVAAAVAAGNTEIASLLNLAGAR